MVSASDVQKKRLAICWEALSRLPTVDLRRWVIALPLSCDGACDDDGASRSSLARISFLARQGLGQWSLEFVVERSTEPASWGSGLPEPL